jgi:hypothetical protein
VLRHAPGLLCRLLLPCIAALLLLAGCGGDDGHTAKSDSSAAPADSTPKAKEPLAVTAKRLERALPQGDCNVLIEMMLHSIQRQTAPNAAPTSNDCAYISQIRKQFRGFQLTKSREFGPAGFSEGTGANVPHDGVAGIVWQLDTDGSWKATHQGIYRPQLDVAADLAHRADVNARRLVDGLKTGNCAELWRVMNPASRFVLSANGQRKAFCRTLAPTYREKSSAFAQIKADGNPALDPLGRTRDFAFYAISLKNGRYIDVVLSGQLPGVPRSQLKQHTNPSVLELATVREPR